MTKSAESEKLQGRYVLGEVIASGGMAEVFRARDEFLGRDVAVKVFRASASAESDFRRQEDEVNVVARLNHPNLVTLLDAAVHRSPAETRIYYVMELVEGTDLKRRLDDGPLVARHIAQVGYDVATALEYVHDNGIVHRDVKPANILLAFNDDGTRVTAKLGDFGIASIGPAQAIADDEVVTGTVAYLSPEQARGEEVGAATDVYALGLVLLQCFSATLAFPGPPQHSAMSRLLDDPEVPDSVPEEWIPLLRAMTAREVRDRPDIHDVALALHQMFAAESGRHRAGPEGTTLTVGRTSAVPDPGVLSTPTDEALTRIAAIAARVLRAPIAIVSVTDDDRIWFESADPTLEPHRLTSPEGASEAGLQFSARVLLTTPDGRSVGSLCVLDIALRDVTDDELATLRDLGAIAIHELVWHETLSLQSQEVVWFDAPHAVSDGAAGGAATPGMGDSEAAGSFV